MKASSMTILFVTPYFSRKGEKLKGGGLEVYLRRVTHSLYQLGHRPIILSLGTKEMCYMEGGVEIYFVHCPYKQLGTGNINLIYERIYRSYVINRKIAEISRERSIDLIQFSSPYSLSLCYYGKTPAVMRLSSYSKIYNNYEKFSEAKIKIWGLCERLAAGRCNVVFAPSNIISKAFSQDVHRPVSVIESPFVNDCNMYDNSIYQKNLQNKKYFLFFGRLVADKGILVIAECLRSFLQMNPAYYFVCCGDDDYINGEKGLHILKRAAAEYKERLLYFQTLQHEALYPIIQHAEFVICPSLIENLSNACIEAMYFKKVVIGTDGASYEQLIDDNESGLLCLPGDSESLLSKMNEAAAMGEEQKNEIGRHARIRIDKLSPEHVVKKLERYYRWIINNV